jgi:hypothetical protein
MRTEIQLDGFLALRRLVLSPFVRAGIRGGRPDNRYLRIKLQGLDVSTAGFIGQAMQQDVRYVNENRGAEAIDPAERFPGS